MSVETSSHPVSKSAFWIGWVLSVLPALLLIFSAVMKFVQPKGFAESLAPLGLPMDLVVGIGVVELACAVIYLIPATAVLGAILISAYMGGAILAVLRVGQPYFPQILVGVAVWAGIFLREPRLRALLPWRK